MEVILNMLINYYYNINFLNLMVIILKQLNYYIHKINFIDFKGEFQYLSVNFHYKIIPIKNQVINIIFLFNYMNNLKIIIIMAIIKCFLFHYRKYLTLKDYLANYLFLLINYFYNKNILNFKANYLSNLYCFSNNLNFLMNLAIFLDPLSRNRLYSFI